MHGDSAQAHSRAAHKQAGGSSRSPNAGGGERTIKRSTFTPEQLHVLEEAFGTNPLPNLATRHALAEELGLTPRTVQVWFQNRRQKMKKMQLASGSTSNDTISSATERDSPLGSMPRNSSTGSFELLNAEFERLNHSPCSEPLDHSPPPAHSLLPRAAMSGRARGDEGFVSLWARGRGGEGEYMEPMPPNFSRSYQSLLGARLDEHGADDEPGCGEAEHRLAGASLPALSEYRLQLMQHLAAVDPSHPSLKLGQGAARGSGGPFPPVAAPRRAGAGPRQAHGAADDDDGCESPYSCAGADGGGCGGQLEGEHLGLDAQGFDTLDAAANLLLFSATAALIHGPRRAQLADQPVGT